MPTYLDLSRAVADNAATRVLQLYGSARGAGLADEAFVAAAAIMVRHAAAQISGLADLALAARLGELTGTQPPPIGASAPEPYNIETDLRAALADPKPDEALAVVARAQSFAAGQWVWANGLRAHKVPGWRRITSGGGCEMCSNLAQATFLPSRITMLAHKGCACHPDPVMEAPDATQPSELGGAAAGAGHGLASQHVPGGHVDG